MIPKRKELESIFNDEKLAVEFLVANNILPHIPQCPEDGYSMTQISAIKFKCKKKTHRKIYSSLSESKLRNLHIKFSDFVYLMHMWICEVSIKSLLKLTRHGSDTIHRAFKLFRRSVSSVIESSAIKIGGPNIYVQLDESKFGKRKYNRGHRVEGVWVFGGVEVTEERKMFAVVVEKRDGETLNELILKHVLPGSIVITDGWKGYNLFKSNLKFSHHWVNHSISFVNSDGLHTNHIEGTWNGTKIKIKPQSRVKGKMQGYLFEFIWRRQNNDKLWNAFLMALQP